MDKRLELQILLEQTLGNKNVYFQPPASVKLNYDAIVYSLSSIKTNAANDGLYLYRNCYTVTFIHRSPVSDVTYKLLKLRYCSFDRRYTADNLYHDVYTLYF